ncbi:MAG: NADH-quinone oxidoreductase subunit C, partial [Clostridia bacterium]|nr:NADH-quinone oxidoreductase subunit C [Clostridia bacterium]
MNNMIKEIKAALDPIKTEFPADSQIAFVVKPETVHNSLAYLRQKGFTQLSIVTCVDWIVDNEFELVYVLFNWTEGIHLQLRARIDREAPVMVTATDIFPGARYYEREVHEFFGVEFTGNEDAQKPLFLEIWDDLPPLRKDFDPQAYSDSKFPMRERGNEFVSEIGRT